MAKSRSKPTDGRVGVPGKDAGSVACFARERPRTPPGAPIRSSDRLGALFVSGAEVGGAAGEPGARDRAGRFALCAVDGSGRRWQLGLGLLLDAEHFLIALAGEQREELLLLD